VSLRAAGARFRASVSGDKNPVPGAAIGTRRAAVVLTFGIAIASGPGSGVEAEMLELPAPCGVGVAETLEVDAARKAPFDGGFD